MIRYIHYILPLLLAGAAAWVQYQEWLLPLEDLAYDKLQAINRLPARDDIVIIAIDEESLSQLGRWPWSRRIHAELINTLTAAEVKAIAMDILFSEISQDDTEADYLLRTAMAKSQRVVLPVYFEEIREKGQLIEIPPIDLFANVAAALGHAHIECKEGICRSVYLKEGVGSSYWPHFALAMVRFVSSQENPNFLTDTSLPGVRSDIQTQRSPMLIYRDYYNLIPFQQKTRPAVISYVDVLQGSVPPGLLKDKIIFVGATATGIHDVMATPLGQLAGIEINGLVYQALDSDKLVQVLAPGFRSVVTFILIFVVLSVFSFFSPARLLASILLAAVVSLILSAVLLAVGRLWFAPSVLVVFLLMFYPLWSWARLEFALRFLNRSLKRLQGEWDSRSRIEQDDESGLQEMLPAKERLGALLFGTDKNTLSKLRGTEIVSRTIEQYIRANRGLEIARQLVLQSISKLQEGVVIFNGQGELVLVNDFARGLFPSLNESSHVDILDNYIELSNAQSWKVCIDKLKEPGAEIFLEGSLNTSDIYEEEGVDLYIQGRNIVIWRPRKAGGRTGTDIILFTFTNVSSLKKSERSRLETLNFISHDLRSPLVSILALIKNARTKVALPVSGSELLEEIEMYANRNLALAESLLQLSRAESTTVESFSLCDMHAIVDFAYSQVHALASTKSIELKLERTHDEVWVLANADLLERAIVNLLSNAIKYSPASTSVTLRLALHHEKLDGGEEPDVVKLSVLDQGTGIPEEEADLIFQKFKRGSNHQREVGAGLGLYFVKTVVQRHHGQINLERNQVGGATFILTLPLSKP